MFNVFIADTMDDTLKSIKSGQIKNLQKRIDEAIRINEGYYPIDIITSTSYTFCKPS